MKDEVSVKRRDIADFHSAISHLRMIFDIRFYVGTLFQPYRSTLGLMKPKIE